MCCDIRTFKYTLRIRTLAKVLNSTTLLKLLKSSYVTARPLLTPQKIIGSERGQMAVTQLIWTAAVYMQEVKLEPHISYFNCRNSIDGRDWTIFFGSVGSVVETGVVRSGLRSQIGLALIPIQISPKLRTAFHPSNMAPIGLKLGQNAFQTIPDISFFDVENIKILRFFSKNSKI